MLPSPPVRGWRRPALSPKEVQWLGYPGDPRGVGGVRPPEAWAGEEKGPAGGWRRQGVSSMRGGDLLSRKEAWTPCGTPTHRPQNPSRNWGGVASPHASSLPPHPPRPPASALVPSVQGGPKGPALGWEDRMSSEEDHLCRKELVPEE